MKIAKGIVVIACMRLVVASSRGAVAGQVPMPQAAVAPTAGPPSSEPSHPEDARSPMASGSSLAITFGAAPGACLLVVVGTGLIFAPAVAPIR